MNIGKQIKRLRKERNMTQERLADYLNISAQAVSKWENNVTTPDIGLLPDISVFFGVKIDELFRMPVESHYERIENMFASEKDLSTENFHYAEQFLLEMLDKNIKDDRAYGDLAHLYNHKARSLMTVAGDYAKVALSLKPEEKGHHIALWDAYQAVCGDDYYDNHFDVILFYKQFVYDNPNYRGGRITLIENLLSDHRIKEAKEHINVLGQTKKDYLYHFYQGDISLLQGDIATAQNEWQKALESNEDVWQMYTGLGERLKKIGDLEGAISNFEKSISIQKSPIVYDGLLALTQIYEEEGQYEQAIECVKRQIDVIENDYHVLSGEMIDKPKRQLKRLSDLNDR